MSANPASVLYTQSTNRGVGAILMVTDIVDPMLDIGSLLMVAYNRKPGKMFARTTSMIALRFQLLDVTNPRFKALKSLIIAVHESLCGLIFIH